MAIYPTLTIDLADPYSDGLVFPMEGSIQDSIYDSSCNGLLIIDKVKDTKGQFYSYWNISYFIYDVQVDDCEIKFKLPLYITQFDFNNN